jgi:hypothetical protein
MKALDLEAVQAFVMVADLKSFTRAAEAMDTTVSIHAVTETPERNSFFTRPSFYFSVPNSG